MLLESETNLLDMPQSGSGPLDETEEESLLRMTGLVERIFRVPIAYFALLGPHTGAKTEVVGRIGSGSAYWKYLSTFPLDVAMTKALYWPNGTGRVPGFDHGEVRFAAWAPLRSLDGFDFGLVVIADLRERPEFAGAEHRVLCELASILAGKMELRMMVCQMRDAELSQRESERRFEGIADLAPIMILSSGPDGAASFVNKQWLRFTGRAIEEELGEGYTESIHPEFRGKILDRYWQAFNDRAPMTMDFPMRRYDGVYCWMRGQGTPRFLDDGTFAGYMGCFIDVDEPWFAAAV
jgi:PAS domain S-box-containing protein